MKFNKESLISQSIVNLVSRVSILLTTLIFYPVISRILTKEEIAMIAVFEFLPSLIDLVPNFGFQTTIIKLLPEKKRNIDEVRLLVQINAYLIQLVYSLFVIIVIIFSKQISLIFLKEAKYSNNMVLIAIWSFIYTLSDRLLIVKQALGEYHYVSFFNMFRYITSRLLAIIFALLGYGVWGIISSFSIVFLISIFIVGKSIINFLFPIVLFKYKNTIINMFKYSFPFYLQGLNRYLASYLDQPLVSILFKPDVLSVYFLVKKIISTFIVFTIDAIREPLVPKLLNLFTINKTFEMYVLYYEFTALLNFLVFVSAIILSVFSSNILSIFIGKQFENISSYFFSFFIYVLTSHIFNNLNIIVFVSKTPIWSLYTSFISGMLNFVASLLLGYIFGVQWFIVGQSIGFFIVSLFLLVKFKIIEVRNSDIKEFFFALLILLMTIVLFISQNFSVFLKIIYLFLIFAVLVGLYWRYISQYFYRLINFFNLVRNKI